MTESPINKPNLPRPHQLTAVQKSLETLKSESRAKVIMACGTGKTLTQLWTAEAMAKDSSSTVLVLVPSLALLKQTRDEWMANSVWPGPFNSLCVCSDNRIGGAGSGSRDDDEDSASLEELGLAAISTTSPDAILSQLNAMKGGPGSPIVIFSTYQSADMLGAALRARGAGQAIDVALFDEAHKTAGSGGTFFSYALSDDNLAIKKRLFYTATPRVVASRNRSADGDFDIVSMDNERQYGPVAYELGFPQAVREGLIVPYKIVISEFVDSDLTREEIDKVDASNRENGGTQGLKITARMLSQQHVLHKTMEQYGLNKALTFHSTIAEAQTFATAGIDTPGINRNHISGSMRMSERSQIMNSFKAPGRDILSNAKCLTEGVDVPAVDLVAFMSPRKSPIDIVQTAGRAMRPNKATNKKFGYILLPLHINQRQGESYQEAIENADFKAIGDVLRALSTSDSDLQDLFHTAMQEVGQGVGNSWKRLKDVIHFDFKTDHFTDEMREALSIRVLGESSEGWYEVLGKLERFEKVHGRYPSGASKDKDEKILGRWVGTQRRKKDTMPAERKAALDAIKFDWGVTYSESFPLSLQAFQDFITLNGRYPNGNSKDKVEKILANWVRAQRQAFKNDTMLADRFAALVAIGFVWKGLEDTFSLSLQAFQDFKALHGRYPSVGSKDKAEKTLGGWVSQQRKTKDTMPADRFVALEAIGFVWGERQKSFLFGPQELKDFIALHGRYPSKDSKDKDEKKLGNWVSYQRRNLKNGYMPAERKAALDAIGFLWVAQKGTTSIQDQSPPNEIPQPTSIDPGQDDDDSDESEYERPRLRG